MDDEFSEADEVVDLFGNPMVPIRDRRGRPRFKKDKENQDFVAVRAAAGWSQESIASALGCDPKTLRKNFSRELDGGQLLVEGMMLDVLLRRVREGHVASVKQLQSRLDRVAVPQKPKAAPKPIAKGKKEERADAASRPDQGYGDLYNVIHRH